MKATVLVCDRCQQLATTSLALTNGRPRGALKGDFCAQHEAELRALFGRPPTKRVSVEEYADLVLEYFKKHGTARPKDLRPIVSSTSSLHNALELLLKNKKLTKTGTRRSVMYKLI
jgi:hypothetical protein